jgi:hypothetical protein
MDALPRHISTRLDYASAVRHVPTGAILLLLVACSGDDGAAIPTGTPTSAVTETASSLPNAPVSFKTPSGNIGCSFYEGEARCDALDYSYTPPPQPTDCDLDWGHAVSVSDDGAGFVCAGDTVFDPDAHVLAYGQTRRVGDLVCESAESGVTCTHEPGGHGFTISRQHYRLF